MGSNSVQSSNSESGGSQTLYLTNNRSSQQSNNYYDSKLDLIGKYFRTKSLPPNYCGSIPIAYVNMVTRTQINVKFRLLYCNSWTCPVCQLKRALKVKYLLRDIALLNKLKYFLTLTLDPLKIPNEYKGNTHEFITKLFNHFRTSLTRKAIKYIDKKTKTERVIKLNKKEEVLKYIWVIEFQENGNAHLHILLNQFIPISVIRKLWVHVGGGHIMRVEKVRSPIGASNYVAEYLIKGIKNDSDKVSQLRYFQRRYSISRSCIRPEYIKPEPFDISKQPNLPVILINQIYNKLDDKKFVEREVAICKS